MKQINLIPWRAQARELRKREFFNSLALAVLTSLLVVAFLHWMLSNTLRSQENNNAIYQQEIAKLNQQLIVIEQIKKQQQASVERINIIDKLQANRSQTVNIFTDLVQKLPPGVYLTSVRCLENSMTITGKAESNTRISMFMRNLEALPWLIEASLAQIQTNPTGGAYNNDFVLELKLKPLQGLDDIVKKMEKAQAATDKKVDKT